jgi:hypothetical protein
MGVIMDILLVYAWDGSAAHDDGDYLYRGAGPVLEKGGRWREGYTLCVSSQRCEIYRYACIISIPEFTYLKSLSSVAGLYSSHSYPPPLDRSLRPPRGRPPWSKLLQ